MPVVPKAANSWRFSFSGVCPRRPAVLARTGTAWTDRRLLTAAQFAAVAAARGPGSVRSARRWLALSACLVPDVAPTQVPTQAPTQAPANALTRLGLVVPKRFARRALDRNLVKRIAREALRAALPALDTAVPAALRMDVVIRLKAPLPPVDKRAHAQFKSALRAEANALLIDLARNAAGYKAECHPRTSL